MIEFIQKISPAEIAVYAGGSIVWLHLIYWLHKEELEAKRKKRFPGPKEK